MGSNASSPNHSDNEGSDNESITDFSPIVEYKHHIPDLKSLCFEKISFTSGIDKYIGIEAYYKLKTEHEYKQLMLINIFSIIIHKCHYCKTSGYHYGGSIRDKLNNDIPKDYDIKLCSMNCTRKATDRLKPKYNIDIVNQNYAGCYSIRVQDKIKPYLIYAFDLTYKKSSTSQVYDFDVNLCRIMLKRYADHGADPNNIYYSNITIPNDKCNLESIVTNIRLKQFIVLAYDGSPITIHNTEHIDNTTAVDEFSRMWHDNIDITSEMPIIQIKAIFEYDSDVFCKKYLKEKLGKDCISRNTHRGKILLKRMKKMIDRGWKCLNETCIHHACIFAPVEIACVYDPIFNKMHDNIKEYNKNERERLKIYNDIKKLEMQQEKLRKEQEEEEKAKLEEEEHARKKKKEISKTVMKAHKAKYTSKNKTHRKKKILK